MKDWRREAVNPDMRTVNEQAYAMGITPGELYCSLGKHGLTYVEHRRINRLLEGLAFRGPEFGLRSREDYLEHLSGRSNKAAFDLTYKAYRRYFGNVSGVNCLVEEDGNPVIASVVRTLKREGKQFCQSLVDLAFANAKEGGRKTIDCTTKEKPRNPLIGINFLHAPLRYEGSDVGSITFYKRGEQPFTDRELDFSRFISVPLGEVIVANGLDGVGGVEGFDDSDHCVGGGFGSDLEDYDYGLGLNGQDWGFNFKGENWGLDTNSWKKVDDDDCDPDGLDIFDD